MELPVTQVSSDCFSVNRKAKRLTAFASDLPCNKAPQDRLYSDACDTGFAVVSSKTRQVSRWYFSKHIFDGTVDNELLETKYEPTPETLRKMPQMKGWVLFIGND